MASLLFVQPDGAVLVQADHEAYAGARPVLQTFAQLEQKLDPIHVYRIRPVTLWEAASAGYTARYILEFLRHHAAHPLPYALQQMIVCELSKWGRLVLQAGGPGRIVLRADTALVRELSRHEALIRMAADMRSDSLVFPARLRADVKRTLIRLGYPVIDRAGYRAAPSISFQLRDPACLRPYQQEAIDRFFAQTPEESGVIVLPCGAGKTLTGIAILARLQMHALVLTPGETSAHQWRQEFLRWTTLPEDKVGIYRPDRPLTPITMTTYQRVTARAKGGERRHFSALTDYPWGIVIYDEVHVLPAPLFRLAASLQGSRRLGLTATLVREDGAAEDVFSLIGPKCYDVPWKQLEQEGYLAQARCVEVRVPLPGDERRRYEEASPREKYRIAASNRNKLAVVRGLAKRHQEEHVLVIGHYLRPLADLARALSCPLVTGQMPMPERQAVFQSFREGAIRCLVLSRVANMAVDLPSASVAIQVSGLFGSRQEEAQRLGRVLRPGKSGAVFYTLVSADTVEERIQRHRQLYLVEQGYPYDVQTAEDVLATWSQIEVNGTEGVTGHEVVGMSELG